MSDLSKYVETGDLEILQELTGVDDRIQVAHKDVAVIYNLRDGAQAELKLNDYLQKYPVSVLILNRPFDVSVPTLVIKKDMWIEFQSALCDKFYPLPRKPKIIAITGTNGKTTTVDLVLQLSSMCGLKAISIGTLGVRGERGTIEDFGLTTPSFVQLRKILFNYAQDIDVVAMEVSSHALDQERIFGLSFYAAAWTNFTQDHLDYHLTMDNYFNAKKKILKNLRLDGKIFFPSTQSHIAEKIKDQSRCVVLESVGEDLRLRLPPFFKTKFNLDNLSLALALVSELSPLVVDVAIRELRPTPGRFYIREWNRSVAIVDFAHTPDALENLLSAVREIYPDSRIKVLFGCGGDRDRSKRPLMGLAVKKYADEIILTSDNPRTEDPNQIIDDIAQALEGSTYRRLEDRPSALIGELNNLKAHEVLVVAGKGHEDYIIKGTTKVPYSDIETLELFLKDHGHD